MTITNFIDTSVILFISIQMLNVIISTIKSILTVNGSKLTASIINAVSYTFANIVTKMLTEQPFEIIILTTFITNMIGVYAAKWLLEKTKKERLWTIMATLRGNNKETIETALQKRSIQYTLIPAENDRWFANIFSHSKAESAMVREILQEHNIKHTIVENQAQLWD